MTSGHCCSRDTPSSRVAITGRALYDGRLDAKAALALIAGTDA